MTNVKINNYKNALVEVEAVLDCLEYDEYIKIPENVINAISQNKNEHYIFEYDEELDYKDWNLMSETKALLYIIFKKYFATNEQMQYFREKENFEIMQREREKTEKYNPDKLFKSNKQNIAEKNEVSKAIIEFKKEKWYKKAFNLIKKLFNKKRI